MVWTKEEIEYYKSIRKKELGPLYALASIRINEPERRAEYLSDKLLLTQTDYDLISRITKEKGKVKALELLEEIAVEAFY